MDRSILLVEDDTVSATLLKTIITNAGYEVTLAKNGREALALFHNGEYPVVVTDLNMPEMSGEELIKEILKNSQKPMIIVESGVQDISAAIDIMKTGVFDYILKPINQTEFLLKIDKAFQALEMREAEQAIERDRELRIQQQLQTRHTVEKILTRDFNKFDRELFSNLKTSFSQGGGFGGLVALISLISHSALKENGKYIISEELMDLVIQNAKMGERALQVFGEIDDLINAKLKLESLTLREFHSFVTAIVLNLSDIATIENHTVKISDAYLDGIPEEILIDREKMTQALREVFINAFKFSVPGSSILVIFNHKPAVLTLSIMSKPVDNKGDIVGIPKEYERVVFEPFFRLTRTVDERYGTLEFGLGLTMVDKVLHRHGAKPFMKNVRDFLEIGKADASRVNFEVEFPLEKSTR